MSAETGRQILNRMVKELPDEMITNVISYIAFVKNESKNQFFRDLEDASQSSMGFWDNPIDDEVWNNA